MVALRTADFEQGFAIELRAETHFQAFLADVRRGVHQVVLAAVGECGAGDEGVLSFGLVAVGAFVADGRVFLGD